MDDSDTPSGLPSHVKRELIGSALLLFAVFLTGALIDGIWRRAGGSGGGCGSQGGIFGPVGSCLSAGIIFAVGAPAAVLLILALLVHALRLFGRLRAATDRSWLMFFLCLAVLMPIALALATGGRPQISVLTGMWGGLAAYYLEAAFGVAGAWIALVLGISALSAATLAWSPLRMLVGARPRPDTGGGASDGDWAGPTSSGDRAAAAALALAPTPSEMPAIELDGSPMNGAEAMVPASGRRKRVARPKTGQASEEEAEDVAVAAAPLEAELESLPPVELLNPPPPRNVDLGRRELDAMGAKLLDALRTFRVEGELAGRTTGPVVTQFEVVPAAGVKVRQIATLANDLALAMRAPSIRIVAPIPGKGAVGVEVPNPTAEIVVFREMVESRDFQTARAALPIALGKDLEGRPVIADLARMPHLLIAGATGSGKSVCVNTIITSLIYRHTPETLRFLMVDPKMVELSVYNELPHLRHKVITDNRDAAAVFKWAMLEMQDRYQLLAANGCRNVQEFNVRVREGATLQTAATPDLAFEERTYKKGVLPYIVVVIDELADLMMTVQAEIETPLALLAQKARAIGIHLILATQRPSVNVITGLIKANFSSRIAFRVASQVDSRTIIDGIGAESLLGNGDMLFIPPGKSEPSRLQGAFISGEETERLIAWYGAQREAWRRIRAAGAQGVDAAPEDDVLEAVRRYEADHVEGRPADEEGGSGDRDPLFREAAEAVIHHQQGSTSLLQRRLRIGYGRAARIIDQLQAAGVLSAQDGPKPREVLVGLEDLPRICRTTA